MRVFKFGGASVKDAKSVKNVAVILKQFKKDKLGIVVSAMGKTTNTFEKIANSLWNQNKVEFSQLIEESKKFHEEILNGLFEDSNSVIFGEINSEFSYLIEKYKTKLNENFDFEYDQIVSIGEVISTKIVSAYLNEIGLNSFWMDARKLIQTNDKFREAEVNWNETELTFKSKFIPQFNEYDIVITQGFIGHTSNGDTTSLGREGSDFSAGIMAYCCDASDVTIWKDVPGMLNADPKFFENTVKLEQISFKEAIELSYYGASVIHPKTIKPLQNKEIPLYVKSFVDPTAIGTVIQQCSSQDHLVPSFIFKMNQILFSITPKDFSFLVEKNLSDIFNRLSKVNAKINLMQNSALNFSILLDADKVDVDELLRIFEDTYLVKFNEGLELITVRHYDDATINRLTEGKEIILQQKTRETARLIVK